MIMVGGREDSHRTCAWISRAAQVNILSCTSYHNGHTWKVHVRTWASLLFWCGKTRLLWTLPWRRSYMRQGSCNWDKKMREMRETKESQNLGTTFSDFLNLLFRTWLPLVVPQRISHLLKVSIIAESFNAHYGGFQTSWSGSWKNHINPMFIELD